MDDLQLTDDEHTYVDAYVRTYGETARFSEIDTTIMLPSGREMSSQQMNAILDKAHGRHRRISFQVRGRGILFPE